ncbi:hypothetical protein [Streptomyces sp. NPDC054863]
MISAPSRPSSKGRPFRGFPRAPPSPAHPSRGAPHPCPRTPPPSPKRSPQASSSSSAFNLAVDQAALPHLVTTHLEQGLPVDLITGLQHLLDRAVGEGHVTDGLSRPAEVLSR